MADNKCESWRVNTMKSVLYPDILNTGLA